MKHPRNRTGKAIAILGIVLAMSASATDLEIDRETFRNALEKIIAERRNELTVLKQKYTESLERVLRRVKQTGDLDNTVAVMKEIERFQQSQSMPQESAKLADIRSVQASYAEQLAKIETDISGKIVKLVAGYEKVLERLQRRLVQEDQLDDARAVQAERKTVQSDPIVANARERVRKHAARSVPAERAVPGTHRWSFDGKTLEKFLMTGGGSFVETGGYVAVKAYGPGKDWYGPQGMRAVSVKGDFEIRTALNYRTDTREQGRLIVGVILQSGTAYRMILEDNHASAKGHQFTFSSRSKTMWSSGRLASRGRLANFPLMMQRRGNVLTFHVDDTRRGSRKGCDISTVGHVFFSIERYSNYRPLTEAGISEIVLLPL